MKALLASRLFPLGGRGGGGGGEWARRYAVAAGVDDHVAKMENKRKLREVSPFYGHFVPTMSLSQFRKEYGHLQAGEGACVVKPVRLAGRVLSAREAGNKMMFLDLIGESNTAKVQVMVMKQKFQNSDNFDTYRHGVKRGDVIGAEGSPHCTKTGELSLSASSLSLLAPCLRRLPDVNALHDIEIRSRDRPLDMIVNEDSLPRLLVRSKLIKSLRNYLDSHGFLEVETPILSSNVGGANALPFETFHRASHENCFLRISPELYLKRLIVGGVERVYEIGKQFRNEGIDSKHNPEFTTCEFYWAYNDYKDLMVFTEQLLHSLSLTCTGSPLLRWKDKDGEVEHTVDLTPPFKRVDIWPELERCVGPLPHPSTLFTSEARDQMMDNFRHHHIHFAPPHTPSRIVDKLISHFIEPQCIAPTFLFGHPIFMSPLAREREESGFAERFELMVMGQELVNAYSELSDPEEQRRRFEMQARERAEGDVEAQILDDDFVRSLEYGMPPTAGWGLGIDRFAMMLTSSHHIRDVLAFPMNKKKN